MKMKNFLLINVIFILLAVVACSKPKKGNETLVQDIPCEFCSLQTYWGSIDSLTVATADIFAIWWDPKFDHSYDTSSLFEKLIMIRNDCLDNLGMADPPNPNKGFFYNVYIHHGDQDMFPNGWALGQGTDPYGLPFLTVPYGSLTSPSIFHEGYHIFQYNANSPGFAYSGDTQWYIESSAQWYMANHFPFDIMTYPQAGAIIGNPQLALWHSFNNEAPDDPGAGDGRVGWMYGVRQYGMHTLLMFLTEVKGVKRSFITDGFYAMTNLSPQEYLYTKIGPKTFRNYFADWAAHNTAGLDYLTREQVQRAYLEITLAGDWNLFRPSVWSSTNSGTDGSWVQPVPELAPRGWAYNVFNITNTLDTTYSFQLEGGFVGTQGAPAHFVGRIVVVNKINGPRYSEMTMSSPLFGEASVSVTPDDSQVYLVVVSVPEYFGSYQNYPYSVKISEGLSDKEPKNDVSCTTCKILVHAITNFMTDPANEATLGDNLRQICSLLFENDPVTLGECDAWIVEYTDDIIELLVNQYLDPEQVCTAIEFCP